MINDNKKLISLGLPVIQSYEFDPSNTSWTMAESTRLLIANNEDLYQRMDLVLKEFPENLLPVQLAYSNEFEVSPQDIFVVVEENEKITNKSNSPEAYKIEIDLAGVKVTASSNIAAMYALRTIKQLLILNDRQLLYGTIIDYPHLIERRLHIDMGRKYFSKDWFIKHIRKLSYLKVNTLQLHFAENLGFRIECDHDPNIVSKDGYLRKSEIKEIISEAQKYGVNIIPSLDSPGHVEHILKVHPEYGQIDKNGHKSKTALDVTNREAINYMKALYSEYMELFEGSTYFHIGADEYMEFDRPPFTTEYKEVLNDYALKELGDGFTWKDVIATYINEIAEHIYQGGFIPRIFNDGVYYGETDPNEPKQRVQMHDYIGIDFWSQMAWNPSIAPLNVFVEKGHTDIYNLNANFFYYVLRNDMPDDGRKQHSFDHLNSDEKIYHEWTPGNFDRNIVDDHSDFIKGAQLSVWCDNPNIVQEETVTKDIANELCAFASKTWNYKSHEIVSFKTFIKNCKKLGITED